jgi:hypothetical protein
MIGIGIPINHNKRPRPIFILLAIWNRLSTVPRPFGSISRAILDLGIHHLVDARRNGKAPPCRRKAALSLTQALDAYRAGAGTGGFVRAGGAFPVVVLSGIHVMFVRSYLYCGAELIAFLVVFMTRYHLLLSLVVVRTAL